LFSCLFYLFLKYFRNFKNLNTLYLVLFYRINLAQKIPCLEYSQAFIYIILYLVTFFYERIKQFLLFN